MKDPLYWMRIKYKLGLTFVLLSLVSLGVGGVVAFTTSKAALQEKIRANVELATQARLDHLSAHLETLKKRTQDFSSDGFIRDAAGELQAAPGLHRESTRRPRSSVKGAAPSRDFRAALRRHLRQNKLSLVPDFFETLVVGRSGKVIASSHEENTGLDLSANECIQRGREAVAVGGVRGPGEGSPHAHVDLCAPLTDKNTREAVGVIVNRVRPEALSQVVVEEAGIHDAGLEFYLIEGGGTFLSGTRSVPFEKAFLKLRLEDPPQAAEFGRVASGLRKGRRSDEVIAAWGRVPGTDWLVFSEAATAQAFLPVMVLRDRLVLLGIILSVVTAILLFFPSKFMIGPIERLRDAARRIAEGDFNVRVGVHSKDEIGQLAGAFNQMAEGLQERARMEERLLHHEKMTVIGEISASLAHEMNTPLASVVMYSQMLREECPKGAPPCGHVDVILRNARACEGTMRSLLNYARRTQTVKKTFDLNDCVQEAVGLCRPLLERSRIRLDLGLESGLPDYVGDHERMRQVFVNLAMNAIQAMESGGTLSIRSSYAATDGLYPEPVGNVTKTLHRPAEGAASSRNGSGPETPAARRTRAEAGEGVNGAGHIRLEFRDTGKGIPPEYSDRIFDSFFTTKPEGVGTGLGLSIARRIVEEHGGNIQLADSSGEGARFLVTLPLGSNGGAHAGGPTRPSVNEVHDSA